MGFLTPMHELGEYLAWTRSGEIQLPDFQRGYKWEDERIRQLLVTVLHHPLGAAAPHEGTDGPWASPLGGAWHVLRFVLPGLRVALGSSPAVDTSRIDSYAPLPAPNFSATRPVGALRGGDFLGPRALHPETWRAAAHSLWAVELRALTFMHGRCVTR